MQETHITTLAGELNVAPNKIAATIDLLDSDATVPFIARYRKEVTGALDETVITAIRDRIAQLRDLDKRRGAILSSLEERDLLTDDLKKKIDAAQTMAVLEDLYLPYKPKRRTRATIARERGLEPLAETIFAQDDLDPYVEAKQYVDTEKEVATIDDALAGARDIIAEWANEDADARSKLRELFSESGLI
ncbi:MAG: RNA-binding transcriptional accessory protein, partial [candidate division Zixibacteria bacterium]|nr:RNA-binding transcriptional accessory protein [candidate division Zixibacteria bacterium]